MDKQHLARALREILPPGLGDGADDLAQLIALAYNAKLAPDAAAEMLADPAMLALLRELAGRTVDVDGTPLRFQGNVSAQAITIEGGSVGSIVGDTPQRLKPRGFLGQPAHWRA